MKTDSFRKFFILLGCFLIGGAGSFFLSRIPFSYSHSFGQEHALSDFVEKVPKEWSLAYFSQMKFEGKDLRNEGILEETPDYKKYEISYLSNQTRISGTLFVPSKKDPPFPLVVSNHGYFIPSEYKLGQGLNREETFLVGQGYVVFHSDYRGHGKSEKNPDARHIFDSSLGYAMDVINGINALKKSEFRRYIDFGRIGMIGHSMGGEIALDIAVTHPDTAKVYILYASASGDGWRNFSRWKEDDPIMTRTTLEEKGDIRKNPEFWAGLNDRNFYKNISRPIYTFHGGDDATVPAWWSKELVAELNALGKKAYYTLYIEQPHEFKSPRENEFLGSLKKIFEKELR